MRAFVFLKESKCRAWTTLGLASPLFYLNLHICEFICKYMWVYMNMVVM